MRHDDTTYLDDESQGFISLAEEAEEDKALAVTVTAGGRQWAYGDEAWGGWDPE